MTMPSSTPWLRPFGRTALLAEHIRSGHFDARHQVQNCSLYRFHNLFRIFVPVQRCFSRWIAEMKLGYESLPR
jgi:hypothetical protein